MEMAMEAWLELLAKFTLLTSLLVIFYFLGATSIRIARMPHQGWPLFHLWGRQELHQTPTQLPFTFSLVESTVSQLDSFTFRLCTTVVPKIRCLWGVDMRYLFTLINSKDHWGEALNRLVAGEGEGMRVTESNNEDVLAVHPITLVKSENQTEYEVTVSAPSEVQWEKLSGTYKYPLAIFFSHSNPDPDVGNPTAIIGLCVILHVRNAVISNKHTAILAQYIKLGDGHTLKLQPLYVDHSNNQNGNDDLLDTPEQPSSADQQFASSSSSSSEPFSTVQCSICNILPVSRAIVPCGHVCVCAQCFSRVRVCPICRGQILYFFKTRSENY